MYARGMKELYQHINNNDFSPSQEMLEAYFNGTISSENGRLVEEWISTSDFGDEIGDVFSSDIKSQINWNFAKGDSKTLWNKLKPNQGGGDIGQFLAFLCSSVIILALIIGSNLKSNKQQISSVHKSIKEAFEIEPKKEASNIWVVENYLAPEIDIQDSIEKEQVKTSVSEYKDSPLSLFNVYPKKEEEINTHVDQTSSKKKEILEKKIIIQPMISDTAIFFSKQQHTLIYNHDVKYLLQFKCVDYTQEYNKMQPILSGLEARKPHFRSEQYPDMTDERVQEFSVDFLLKEGFKAFLKRNYKLAINKFNLVLEHYPEDLNAQFYKALSYYEMGHYNESVKILRRVAEADINVFNEESEWYLTQSHYKLGEIYETKNLLRLIISSNGYYSEKAKKMMKDID